MKRETLAKKEPDLALLDIRMPGLDGYQVLERIRENSNVPVQCYICYKQYMKDIYLNPLEEIFRASLFKMLKDERNGVSISKRSIRLRPFLSLRASS
ncbi:MAG: hypothetical protein A3G93_13565 [Nitrospinae bacterium RIFCSPLOWO2_12_FULL_45_22]|nr:MAG: hypothetical protein A3G93_13565 [Nitrospinae bacterium RIFCSPLOWO2_12_FULL_45_22]